MNFIKKYRLLSSLVFAITAGFFCFDIGVILITSVFNGWDAFLVIEILLFLIPIVFVLTWIISYIALNHKKEGLEPKPDTQNKNLSWQIITLAMVVGTIISFGIFFLYMSIRS